MKNKILMLALILTLVVSIAGVTVVNADAGSTTNPPPASGTAGSTTNPPVTVSTTPIPALQNPLQATSVTTLLTSLADIAIFIGAILAVLMFIFIGFKFVMARGNESKLKEAKEWFLYAAIGTAILVSAKVIVQVVEQTFISAGVVNSSLFNQPK